MAKLTQGATICHVYLSYKMWYTWQVAGVGAGYIGKDKLTRDNMSQLNYGSYAVAVLGAF